MIKNKLKQFIYDHMYVTNQVTFYWLPGYSKDFGGIINSFNRFGLKIIYMDYTKPGEDTDYMEAITFKVKGTNKNMDLHEKCMIQNYKLFDKKIESEVMIAGQGLVI